MRLQLNRFLLILMMLVLPVQTFASATTLGCAFSHQGRAMSLMVAEHAMSDDSHAMSDDSMATCHESEETDKSPTSHSCKHCTACHLVSALMVPEVAATPLLPISHSIIPHADDAFIGFIPDSPERPPRVSLA